MELHLPCRTQRRCEEHTLGIGEGSHRSAAEYHCRARGIVWQDHITVVPGIVILPCGLFLGDTQWQSDDHSPLQFCKGKSGGIQSDALEQRCRT